MIVESFFLAPGATVPTNNDLPVIAYRRVFHGENDHARAFEAAFAGNGWQGLWRNGIYDYHHYHSGAHEVLGIARGHARIVLGGPEGREVAVTSGDCLLLPAGTGHCRISASPDLLVIGGYPPGQRADMQSGPVDATMLEAIRNCPLPEHDPVGNEEDGVAKLWRGSAS